jgi:hypothetical protein
VSAILIYDRHADDLVLVVFSVLQRHGVFEGDLNQRPAQPFRIGSVVTADQLDKSSTFVQTYALDFPRLSVRTQVNDTQSTHLIGVLGQEPHS